MTITPQEWLNEAYGTSKFFTTNANKISKFVPQAWGMSETFELMFDKKNLKHARKFQPRPTDIFIVTAPKCGTTWLQQIVHQLRTRGDMNFQEISQVVPWLETTYGMGIDPQSDQVAEPRCYKTHLPEHYCPKGAGKYIYVCREPKDAMLSMYNMVNGWILEWSDANFYVELVMRTFWNDMIKNPQLSPVWEHIVSWFPRINDPNVLWLHYEDLISNLPYCVELIANFLDIGKGDAELQKLVVERSTFEFMKSQGSKFKYMKVSNAKLRKEKKVIPRKISKTRIAQREKASLGGPLVNNGEVGRYKKQLNQYVVGIMDDRWKRCVQKATGCETYEQLRQYADKAQGIDLARLKQGEAKSSAAEPQKDGSEFSERIQVVDNSGESKSETDNQSQTVGDTKSEILNDSKSEGTGEESNDNVQQNENGKHIDHAKNEEAATAASSQEEAGSKDRQMIQNCDENEIQKQIDSDSKQIGQSEGEIKEGNNSEDKKDNEVNQEMDNNQKEILNNPQL